MNEQTSKQPEGASSTVVPANPPDTGAAAASPVYVKGIAPYQGGRPIEEIAREYGLDADRIVKLASNENPLGMPDSARAAVTQAMRQIGRYPDGNGFDLKRALAARHDVPADWLTLGNGSNDILELAAHALCAPGQSIVYSQYSFAVYALATQALGARAIVTPARDLGHDLDAMASAIRDDTRLVFVANPNNPTGTYLSAAALERFIDAVPSRVAIVLDEAYTEYLDPSLRADSIGWVRKHPNLIVSRTFSKAYGLAGLRVGFAVAQPAITDLLNRIRQPFNVNSLAQAAAVAALGDEAFLARSLALNRDGLAQLQQGFERLGLRYVPSFGNFVLVEVGDAAAVNESMLRAGVIVRPVANYGLPTWLRISVGLAAENDAALAALAGALGRA
ncbi:MAG: histidinol-phosphate transaminase [Lautropia sp.]